MHQWMTILFLSNALWNNTKARLGLTSNKSKFISKLLITALIFKNTILLQILKTEIFLYILNLYRFFM